MMYKLIFLGMATLMLANCGYVVAGGAGYVAGRELEEDQGVDEPEVYK